MFKWLKRMFTVKPAVNEYNGRNGNGYQPLPEVSTGTPMPPVKPPKKNKYTFNHDNARIEAMNTPGYMKHINQLEKELEVYKGLSKKLMEAHIDITSSINENGKWVMKVDTSRLVKIVDEVMAEHLEENE